MEHNENKPTSVFIRLKPELAAVLDAAASAAGLSRAGWVRAELVRALPTNADIALPPSPPRRPITIPPQDLAEISRLSASLSRTGGAVVQLCKALRETGNPLHDDAEATLAELRAVQRDIISILHHLFNRMAVRPYLGETAPRAEAESFLDALMEDASEASVSGG